MAEYRIVAKVDPQTAAGTNKVKQDLRGIQQEANATETALNRSFDQAKFDRTIGGLVDRLDRMEKGLANAGRTSAQTGKAFDTTTGSLDRMTAAEFRAAGGLEGLSKAAGNASTSNARLDAALMRVLRAVDQSAAEQAQLNALMIDAKRLYEAGAISAEQYARAQAMAAASGKEQAAVTGQQRAGFQQLGFQLGDVATMYSLGARPAQIFASQIGQISQALSLMGGGNGSLLSKVAGFLGGPWGVALTIGAIVAAPLLDKLLATNNTLEDSIKKLKEDARETEMNAKAKEAFARTLEGTTAAIREQNKALKESIQTQRDSIVEGMKAARQRLATIEAQRAAARQEIVDAQDALRYQTERASGSGQGADLAALGLSRATERVEEAKRAYKALEKDVAAATEAVRRADAALAQDAASRAVDPIKKLNDEYDRQRNAMIETAVASEQFSAPALARELTLLEQRRKAALEAASAQDRLNDSVATGVATFKSREQAVGIAGKEIQRAGFRVSENEQFGGVKGNHPGMGNKAHGKYAIDVNMGSGIVEADVPDLRAKFDAMAKRYAARGYKVLWNGNVYWPDGKVTPIQGANKHRDHIHLEAPGTIIGKPTQASTEAQAQREDGAADREAAQEAALQERATDFVSAIVARAASRGLPNNRQSQLQADIDEAFADFERRFNRAADFAEKWEIVTALQDADARETARAFEQAYVEPVERLAALQGKTGIERDILNAKLEETIRLGRELRPEEEAMIENGIRQGDQLTRQNQILEAIQQPLEEYRAQIAALNALLSDGSISAESYNARLAEMAATAAGGLANLPGVDPGTGMAYEDVSAVSDENARYASQLEQFQVYREQLLQMGVDFNALEEAAYQQHMMNLAAIDEARRDVSLNAISSMAGSTTSVMRDMFGEQSKLYKAAFAAEKAVAIARAIMAIQTGIAQAAALPFPANLPAIASVIAATASIVSNIQAVALNFKDGGRVPMVGGPRSDSVGANLSAGEYVVNARDTARNLPLLEAINSGRDVRQAGRASAAATARETVAAMPSVNVTAPPAEVKVINVNDPRAALAALGTAEGTQVIMNMMESNPGAFRRVLGAN